MRDWKSVFIFVRPELKIQEDWFTRASIAPRNMWDAKSQEHVVEAVPMKQYLADCDESYKRGFAQGVLTEKHIRPGETKEQG